MLVIKFLKVFSSFVVAVSVNLSDSQVKFSIENKEMIFTKEVFYIIGVFGKFIDLIW